MAAPMNRVSAVTKHLFLGVSKRSTIIALQRCSSITGHEKLDKTLDTVTAGKIGGWLNWYENVVGLTEVREAQEKVIQAENKFHHAQVERREQQVSVTSIQAKMKDIHAQLDKVQRGDEKYLALLTEEYELIKQEKLLTSQLNSSEEMERTRFSALSSAVRESHEKERSRTERTKYWSIIGSMVGALIGIIGASINNYLRNRELKRIVKESAAGGIELKSMVAQLADTTQDQHNHIQGFVTDLKSLMKVPATGTGSVQLAPVKETVSSESSNQQLEAKTKEILAEIQRQDETLHKEMEDIKKLLVGGKVADQEGTVVYVGPELEQLLVDTENNIEWKIKANALWSVTFMYGAFALTLPILYWIFKGN